MEYILIIFFIFYIMSDKSIVVRSDKNLTSHGKDIKRVHSILKTKNDHKEYVQSCANNTTNPNRDLRRAMKKYGIKKQTIVDVVFYPVEIPDK